ncbi:Uncharacterised protein [Legionella pneumophila]|nr:Uncharacterised protein [Legionella pneumophila]
MNYIMPDLYDITFAVREQKNIKQLEFGSIPKVTLYKWWPLRWLFQKSNLNNHLLSIN